MSDIPVLTPKMAQGNGSPNLKLFFPCADGAGNDLVDIVGGVVVTDQATLEWTTAHAADISTTRESAVQGTMPTISESASFISFSIFECVILSAFAETTFGYSLASGAGISMAQATSFIVDDDNNKFIQTNGQAFSAGDTMLIALVHDARADALDRYEAKNAASVTKQTGTGSTLGRGAMSLPAAVTMNLSSAQHQFGSGLYVYEDGILPSQAVIEEELTTMYNNFLKGHKIPSAVL